MQSKPVLAFLAILMLIFAWSVIGLLGKMASTRENRKIAQNKLIELEKQKQQLSSDIEKLKTDEGVEESIRTKFGLAREGEGVIVIVEDQNPPKTEEVSSGGFWSFFTNWFK